MCIFATNNWLVYRCRELDALVGSRKIEHDASSSHIKIVFFAGLGNSGGRTGHLDSGTIGWIEAPIF